MGTFDVAELLRAAHPRLYPRETHEWRCAVYLSASSWRGDDRDASVMLAEQSAACKGYLARHPELRRVATLRNRNAVRNTGAEFERLMGLVENRRVDAVMVQNVTCFGTSHTHGIAHVERVLLPAGFRFIDVSHGFDSEEGGTAHYIKQVDHEQRSYRACKTMLDFVSEERVMGRWIPYGYARADGAPGGVAPDPPAAPFVRPIFEMAAGEVWNFFDFLAEVVRMGAPSEQELRHALYNKKMRGDGGWTKGALKKMLANPFYTGDYVPESFLTKELAEEACPEGGWQTIRGHHEALVSRELFEAAQEGVARNRRRKPDSYGGWEGGRLGKEIEEGRWLFE